MHADDPSLGTDGTSPKAAKRSPPPRLDLSKFPEDDPSCSASPHPCHSHTSLSRRRRSVIRESGRKTTSSGHSQPAGREHSLGTKKLTNPPMECLIRGVRREDMNGMVDPPSPSPLLLSPGLSKGLSLSNTSIT